MKYIFKILNFKILFVFFPCRFLYYFKYISIFVKIELSNRKTFLVTSRIRIPNLTISIWRRYTNQLSHSALIYICILMLYHFLFLPSIFQLLLLLALWLSWFVYRRQILIIRFGVRILLITRKVFRLGNSIVTKNWNIFLILKTFLC